MWLKRLALTHFRSYSRLGLELPPGVVVLHGANGQGKTNLLEAVYVLATTKSPRAGGDRELVSWQTLTDPTAFARVAATACGSMSTASTQPAPQRAAPMARMPEPQP